jgi:hypothetical protein
MSETDAPSTDALAAHQAMGKLANNTSYDLFGLAERTPEQDAELVHRAHAAAYHWGIAGTAVHRARSEYLVSRAHAFVGQGESALYHARRCLDLVTGTSASEMADFDLAFAREAMARALAASGDLVEARRWHDLASSTPIADDEDREICTGDLADGPWFGLND